jgi:hypothetical protein
MDPFDKPYWSQLQVVLWVCTRSKEALRLAADQRPVSRDLANGQDDWPGFDDDLDLIAEVVMPGGRIAKRWRSRLRPDCSFKDAEEQVLDGLGRGRLRASGRRNGEGDREQIPRDQWAELQFYWAQPLREFHLPQSVSSSSRYAGPRDPLRHNATYWIDVLFESEEVLALWKDPIPDILWAKTERLTLAEAVALLVRGRPASKEAWRRLRRRHRGRFPTDIEQSIEEAGQDIVKMLRRCEITASGRPCVRDIGNRPTGGMKRLDGDLLDEPLWVDPCADGIWTEPRLDDGFNPIDRGYRNVVLKREQSLEAVRAQGALRQPENGGSRARQDDAPDFRSEDAVVVDLGDAIHWIAFGYAAAPKDHRASAVWDDAERQLIRALQLGEVVASGFRHGRGERQEIPSRFWIDAEVESLKSYAFRKNQWSRENEWEEVRLYRRDIIQRWPSPLSSIQDEPAVETLASRPAEVSLADTRPWWPLTAVVAWILVRDLSAVAALCRPLSAVDKGAILLRAAGHSDKAPRVARRELIDALAAAEVTAHGDRGTGNGLQPIPAVEWSGPPEYLLEGGTDRVGPYRDVVIARAEVLQRWPSPRAVAQDELAVEKSMPGAADGPARVCERAEERSVPQQQPKRGHSAGRLKEWYRNTWIKRNESEGKIPTREEDWKAAKSEVSPDIPRDAVRRLRQELAPASWTKRRRRKEIGGN